LVLYDIVRFMFGKYYAQFPHMLTVGLIQELNTLTICNLTAVLFPTILIP